MHDVWRAIEGHYNWQQTQEVCREEFSMLMAVLPLLAMDFRLPLSAQVTASDASEEGGGICCTTQLTTRAHPFLSQALRANQGIAIDEIGLVETFSGIGGVRRAFEVLGLKPAFYVAIDSSGEAQRVSGRAWPDAIHTADVRTCDHAFLQQLRHQFPNAKRVLRVSTPPRARVSPASTRSAKA